MAFILLEDTTANQKTTSLSSLLECPVLVNPNDSIVINALARGEIPFTSDQLYLFELSFVKSMAYSWLQPLWARPKSELVLVYNHRIFTCNCTSLLSKPGLLNVQRWLMSFLSTCSICQHSMDDLNMHVLPCCNETVCAGCDYKIRKRKAFSCKHCNTRNILIYDSKT